MPVVGSGCPDAPASCQHPCVPRGEIVLTAAETRVALLAAEISEGLERGLWMLLGTFVTVLARYPRGVARRNHPCRQFFFRDTDRFAASVGVTAALLSPSLMAIRQARTQTLDRHRPPSEWPH